jgi:16S rRNA G966 N2-methylase RsmD
VLAWVPAVRNDDLALVDPPYSFEDWPRLLSMLQAAYVLCESAREVPPPDGWQTVRARRYGRTSATLLARDD